MNSLRPWKEEVSCARPAGRWEALAILFSGVMSRRTRVRTNPDRQDRLGNAMQGPLAAGRRAPSSANFCRHEPEAPEQAPFGGLAGRGQAIRARGAAPPSADAAGWSRSIGSAIAFHPRAKRRRDPSPQPPPPRRFAQTFCGQSCKRVPPDLKGKSSCVGGVKTAGG